MCDHNGQLSLARVGDTEVCPVHQQRCPGTLCPRAATLPGLAVRSTFILIRDTWALAIDPSACARPAVDDRDGQ